MILYVYSKKYGLSVTDTNAYQEGSFRLTHTDTQGHARPLVSVEREGENWVAYDHSQVHISVNHADCSSITLEHGMVCVLTASGKDVYFLLCIDENAEQTVRLYSLPATGVISIGREDCDISYPFGLVSRNHAVLRINQGQILLEDNNSTNGTYLNGSSIAKQELDVGDSINLFGLHIACLGACISVCGQLAPVTVSAQLRPYTLRAEKSSAGSKRPVAEEDDLFERAPRIAMKHDEEHLRIDDPPAGTKPDEMPLAFTVGSSALMSMSSMMMAITSLQNVQMSGGSIMQALPSMFMACSMFVGGLAMPIITRKYTDKRNEKKEQERQQKYLAYLGEHEQKIAAIGEKQKEYLLQNYPANDVLNRRVASRSPLIWGRMPKHGDFLDLRLGTATLPVDVQIDYPRHNFSLDEDTLRTALQDFEDKEHTIDDAPFVLSLKKTGILGIFAEHSIRMKYVQGLLMQLCAQHSYTEMKLVLIHSKAEEQEWEWARWLPHVWNDSREFRAIGTDEGSMRGLSAYIDSLCYSDPTAESAHDVHCVVVVTDMHLAGQCPALMEAMRAIHAKPLSIIALAERANQLPRECKSVVTLNETDGYLYRDIDELDTPLRFVQDPLPPAAMRAFATQLGNMRLAGGASDGELPDTLPFYTMMRWGRVEQSDLISRWQQSNPMKTLAAPIGVDKHGDRMMLDIHQNAHGPHGVIAGMTGSGKSEFIITYILSMAVQYSPLEVGFVLIDYKGGGMSDTLKNLPHVVGVIDNLGGKAGIHRSMHSLESELKRRQRVFKEVGERTKNSNLDIYRYQKLYREGLVDEPMQHIVIISDEFAELKQQEQEFMDYLVSAARIGRSLGVHLILATQKPVGVVDGQIMSNTRFRVCMKVQEKADSMEMLGRPDAAMLTKIGRYYLQVGFNEIFALGQSAWCGAPSIPMDRYREEPDKHLELIGDNGAVLMKAKPPSAEDQIKRKKQVDELVDFIHNTAEANGLMPDMIWKPMLEAMILMDSIDKQYTIEYKPGRIDPVVGMLDDPFMQQQGPLQLDLTNDGNAVLYGVTGSGKSEFITAAVYSLCMHHSPKELNIYCLDFAAEAAKMFSNMPQVGAVVVTGEDEKLHNLMLLLKNEIARRRKLLADYAGALDSFREENPNVPMPSILVTVDNYTAFAEGYEDYDEIMYQIAREGSRFGVHMLITCINASSLRYRMAQNFKQIYCMQMPDKSDYTLLLGSSNGVTPMTRLGSGICRRDGRVLEFQVARVRDMDPRQMKDELFRIGQQMKQTSSGQQAQQIRILPEVVTTAMLRDGHSEIPLDAVPVGLDKETIEPVRWNIAARFFHQIGYSDQPDYSFTTHLAEILSCSKARTVVCFDALGTMDAARIGSAQLYRGADMVAKSEEFLYTCLERNNAIKTALESKTAMPEYDEYVVIVNGMTEWFDALAINADVCESMKIGLGKIDVLMRSSREVRLHLIFTQSTDRIGVLNTMPWYRDSGNKDGLWLGEGIRKQYMVSYENVDRNEKLPQGPFGYLIRYSKACCVKLVSG